jgi:hypothetical protein
MSGFGGLSDSLRYTEFEFDSLQAQNSLNNQYYTTDWPLFLLGKPLGNIAAIKVIQAEIPFSWYVFNTSNNTFYLTESTGGGAQLVTIPVGNYAVSGATGVGTVNITAALATALNSASANTYTYTVTYQPLTQTLSITKTGSGTFTLTFGTNLNDPGYTNPRLMLGFSGGTNTSTGNTLNAPSVIQLTGPNYLYINSVTLGATVKLYLPANYASGALLAADGPPMCKVPVNVQPGGIIYWTDPDPTKYFDVENQSNLAQVDFYCSLGDNPAILDFNGNSFSLKLAILTNESQHNDYLGGGKQNDRVMTRTWATGAGYSSF